MIHRSSFLIRSEARLLLAQIREIPRVNVHGYAHHCVGDGEASQSSTPGRNLVRVKRVKVCRKRNGLHFAVVKGKAQADEVAPALEGVGGVRDSVITSLLFFCPVCMSSGGDVEVYPFFIADRFAIFLNFLPACSAHRVE